MDTLDVGEGEGGKGLSTDSHGNRQEEVQEGPTSRVRGLPTRVSLGKSSPIL